MTRPAVLDIRAEDALPGDLLGEGELVITVIHYGESGRIGLNVVSDAQNYEKSHTIDPETLEPMGRYSGSHEHRILEPGERVRVMRRAGAWTA